MRITATHLDPSGDGVAVDGDVLVLVPGLFGGETADVAIEHRSRQHPRAVGRLSRLVVAHPERRAAPCPRHRARPSEGRASAGRAGTGGECDGCGLMELTEPAQRAAKQMILSSLGLAIDAFVCDEDALGYRFSSKRVVFAGPDGAVQLGSWARGTHEGADMRGCLVDHPRIRDAADEVAREATALGVAPYDERAGLGDLRYVWLKTDGERVLLTLVTAGEESAAERLAERLSVPDGIAWSVQSSRGNAVRGTPARILRGVERLAVHMAGIEVEVGPLGFLQPNPNLIARAYRDLLCDERGDALAGALAWDLYAGAGVTTRMLRAHFGAVVPCESYPESAAALAVEPSSAEAFLTASTGAPDLVIANPPRKGLGARVVAALIERAPPRLHIMSCGAEGLARDLRELTAGGYRLASLCAYDALPQTPHVELVAKLHRS